VHGYANRVLFRQACAGIPRNAVVLEVGPHALLRSAVRQNRPDLQYVSMMKRGESSVETLQDAVAALWLKGATVTWPGADVAPDLPCEQP
jgi:fatty acid synthase